MFKSTIFGSELANNNGCGQYALIGVRLLFEGGVTVIWSPPEIWYPGYEITSDLVPGG